LLDSLLQETKFFGNDRSRRIMISGNGSERKI